MRCFYTPDLELSLPAGHPFPIGKFRLARELLLDHAILRPEEIIEVPPSNPSLLHQVHDPAYIQKIANGALDRKEQIILGLPPSPSLFKRSAMEVEATRLACHAALTEGVAVALGGGNHRAFHNHGEAFSVFNDVAIAIRDLQKSHPNIKIMVVDTDARQGDGTTSLLAGYPRVFTYSIHVPKYPNTPSSHPSPGSLDVPTIRYIEGEMYLKQLFITLAAALDAFTPDLVIWISGADNHRNDLLGQMNLSLKDMERRDDVLLNALIRNRIPVAVLYGGGFNRQPEFTAKLHRNTIATAKRLAALRGL